MRVLAWETNAQETVENLSLSQTQENTCHWVLSLHWPHIWIRSQTHFFPVSNTANITQYDWVITDIQNQQIATLTTTGDLYYTFPETHTYQLQSIVRNESCEYADVHTIKIYNDSYFYIGQYDEIFDSQVERRIEDSTTNFSKFILSEDVDADTSNVIVENNANIISQSKVILYYHTNYSFLFSLLDSLEKKGLSFSEKNIVIIADNNQDLVRKFLASRIQKSNRNNISLISRDFFEDSMIHLSLWEEEKNIFPSPLAYTSSRRNISFEWLVDLLLYRGFSLQLISALLAFAVLVLLIVTTKQIAGYSGYSYYFPLLSGLLLYITSREITVFLLFLWLISHYSTKRFFKYINLLYYGKLGVYTIVYIILMLVSLWLLAQFTNIQFDSLALNENTLLLGLIIAPMISKKLATESKYPHKIWRWLHMGWFWFLSRICSAILGREWLRFWLLTSPEIILVLLFLTVLVWRFTGLQVSEYIRFAPLIRRGVKKKRKQLQKN